MLHHAPADFSSTSETTQPTVNFSECTAEMWNVLGLFSISADALFSHKLHTRSGTSGLDSVICQSQIGSLIKCRLQPEAGGV